MHKWPENNKVVNERPFAFFIFEHRTAKVSLSEKEDFSKADLSSSIITYRHRLLCCYEHVPSFILWVWLLFINLRSIDDREQVVYHFHDQRVVFCNSLERFDHVTE